MKPLLRVTLLLALSLLAVAPADAQEPLFTIVQISDSQPNDASDQLQFEAVLDTIVAGGQNGALLPRLADLVIFPGDLVWSDRASRWDTFVQTMDSRLTAIGIPYFAVPGNHDNSDFDFSLYDQYIASPDPWDFGSASFTGHNGIGGSTGWNGLRFIGFNSSNGGDNVVSAQDQADVESRVVAAAAAGENVFLVGHYAHDHGGPIPLQDVLETPEVRGYMRGHAGTTAANHGLDGTSNDDAWELNSQSIFEDGALIYLEVFETEIDVYVLTLVDGPTELPPAETIVLAHALTPTAVEPPIADFDAAPDLGPAPLNVAFTDLSTGPPSSWYWEFGDGATSGLQHPVHTYTEAGVYSVTLTVTNGGGSDSLTRSDLVSVGAAPPNVAFQAVADAKVRSSSADTNYGLEDGLRIKESSTIYDSYLKFDVTGLDGAVASAVLRIYVTDGGDDGGTLYEVDNGWTETGVTWNNAPSIGGAPLGSAGAVSAGWIEFDVSAVVTGGGTYSFALTSDDSSSVYFSSREGANPPELLVESGDQVAPTADFGAAPRSGGTPLSVDFTDLSSGAPTSWAWAFGDGGSSTAQHPTHVYTGAGTYTVSLTATNAEGSDTTTRAGYVVVTTPLPPTADFDVTPTDGSAPLSVAFTDLSTGPPSSWLWEFGDGATSGLQHPVHVYTAPGIYSVTLTATNGGGSDSVTRTSLINVGAPSPIVTFQPVADAKVRSSRADTNYGLEDGLRVKDGSTIYDSYLKFDVTGLGGGAASAVLRIYVTDGGADGGTLYEVDDGWTETGVTWNNAPPIGGAPLGSAGAVPVGWLEFDVSAVVTGEGTYSFALTNDDGSSVYFSSREGAFPPELVVESGNPVAPTADFSGTPRSGGTPLSVDFTDLSSGGPTSWAWTFGDGGSSSAQHPNHLYTSAGTYSVSLTATNASGSDTTTRVGYVVVTTPQTPTADFDALPTNGSAPLNVAFTDLSTGSPSTWLWEFGDGATSGLQHPAHTYTQAGLYSVTLTVTNGAGSDSVTQVDLVDVGAATPVLTLHPVADARVRSRSSLTDTNYGLEDKLTVKDGGSIHDSYLQFDVAGLGGAVVSAVLRLYVTGGGKDGGTLYEVGDGWTETGITWNNAPPIGGAPLGSAGAVSVGWVEFDVSAAVTGDGTYSFALTSDHKRSVTYSSREGANPPELILTTIP